MRRVGAGKRADEGGGSVSEKELLVRYEQLTEEEQALMWTIWRYATDGYSPSFDEFDAVTNLHNFGLVYQTLAGRFHYSQMGREMMVARKLADRDQATEKAE